MPDCQNSAARDNDSALRAARRDGADAKLNNQAESRNPYTWGTRLYLAWQEGYSNANIGI